MEQKLLFQVPVQNIEKSDGPEEGDWIVSGPVSTPDEDLEEEVLETAEVEKALETYRQLGEWIDWDHKYPSDRKPEWLIGRGVRWEKKDGLPWLHGRLFKGNPIAQDVAQKMKEDPGAKFFWSVYGPPPKKRAGNRPKDFKITMVSLTPWAVNPNCAVTFSQFAKSLTAGSGSTWEATGGAALRREDVEGKPVVTTGKPQQERKRRRRKRACSSCGTVVRAEHNFCPRCGLALRRPRKEP